MKTRIPILPSLLLLSLCLLGQRNKSALANPTIVPTPLSFPGDGRYGFVPDNNGSEDILVVAGDNFPNPTGHEILTGILASAIPADRDFIFFPDMYSKKNDFGFSMERKSTG